MQNKIRTGQRPCRSCSLTPTRSWCTCTSRWRSRTDGGSPTAQVFPNELATPSHRGRTVWWCGEFVGVQIGVGRKRSLEQSRSVFFPRGTMTSCRSVGHLPEFWRVFGGRLYEVLDEQEKQENQEEEEEDSPIDD